MKVELPKDSLEFLNAETESAREVGRGVTITPHFNLLRFQPTVYELSYDEKYAFWLLYSKKNGVDFLSLDKVPNKEFDDFITFWVETHTKIN